MRSAAFEKLWLFLVIVLYYDKELSAKGRKTEPLLLAIDNSISIFSGGSTNANQTSESDHGPPKYIIMSVR